MNELDSIFRWNKV